MRSVQNTFFNSIRFKLISGLLVVMLPILSFLIYNSYYSIHVVRNQVTQSNSNLLHLYMGLIDKELENIDSYLYQLASHNTSLNYLDRLDSKDLDMYNLARYQLFSEMYAKSKSYSSLDLFFAYSVVNEDLVLSPNDKKHSIPELTLIKDEIREIVQDQNRLNELSYDKWSSTTINETPYLIHIIKIGEVYIGAFVSSKDIMMPLDLLDLGENGHSLLVDVNNQPLQDAQFYKNNHIDLNYDLNTYHLTGQDQKYLVIGKKSNKGDFSLLAVIPDRNIVERLPYTQQVILIIAVVTVIILIGALYFLRKVVLLPINRIMAAMRKITNGILEVTVEKFSTSYEFQHMNETFNSMISQIQKLKIDIYEEQLNNQKAELKHLQLQVNPHFYLNSLNIMYYLADDKNYSLIKEMSFSLIQYFRFMFQSHSDFVLMKDELEHVRNYLRIQELRFSSNLTYEISVLDSLHYTYIPPLFVQTFVENAIKYAVTLDEPVHLYIKIDYDDNEEYERNQELIDNKSDAIKWINIKISDTGKGFEEHILQKLQQNISLTNELGEHLGIWNVKRRLWLLYQGQASITFHNDHGAVVEMRLPLQQQRGG